MAGGRTANLWGDDGLRRGDCRSLEIIHDEVLHHCISSPGFSGAAAETLAKRGSYLVNAMMVSPRLPDTTGVE
jgi:hypothetical protein